MHIPNIDLHVKAYIFEIEAYFGDYYFLFSIVLGPHLIIYILADSFSLPTVCKVYFHHPITEASCRILYKLGIYLFILVDNNKCYNIIIITFYTVECDIIYYCALEFQSIQHSARVRTLRCGILPTLTF
jgi:hypothetical protein